MKRPAYPGEVAAKRAKESVWDYPRPPGIEPLNRRVRVILGGDTIAESERALRVLETSSPPTVYVPREDVRTELLTDAEGHHTVCEWKGRAHYVHVEAGGKRGEHAAWHYPEPELGPPFEHAVHDEVGDRQRGGHPEEHRRQHGVGGLGVRGVPRLVERAPLVGDVKHGGDAVLDERGPRPVEV